MSLRDTIKEKIADLEANLKELDTIEGKTYEVEQAASLRKRVKNKPHSPRYSTGIFWLDINLSGGFTEGSFINIAGENFSGKSTLVLQILGNIAESSKCLFFSFEMYENLLAKKIETLTDNQLNNLLIEQYRNDLDEITGLIKLYASRGVKFFAIDSKMKIKVQGSMEEHQKVSKISATLAKLCQELGVIIILINQISEADLKNGRFSLKGSGDQAYDSDVMFFITAKESEQGITTRTLFCTKDRHNGKKWKSVIPEYFSKSVQSVDYQEEKITMAVI